MDQNNPVIQLCTAGTQAEFDGSMEAACELYRQAWEASTDDYEAYITAHYVACCQESPKETFRWNREALEQAKAIDDDSIKDFYPSLYLNMSRSYYYSARLPILAFPNGQIDAQRSLQKRLLPVFSEPSCLTLRCNTMNCLAIQSKRRNTIIWLLSWAPIIKQSNMASGDLYLQTIGLANQ